MPYPSNDPPPNVAGEELAQFIERIEKLEAEKSDIAADIKDIYAEAKGRGYDGKVLRQIIRRRKKDADELAEEEAVLSLYEEALESAWAAAVEDI